MSLSNSLYCSYLQMAQKTHTHKEHKIMRRQDLPSKPGSHISFAYKGLNVKYFISFPSLFTKNFHLENSTKIQRPINWPQSPKPQGRWTPRCITVQQTNMPQYPRQQLGHWKKQNQMGPKTKDKGNHITTLPDSNPKIIFPGCLAASKQTPSHQHS